MYGYVMIPSGLILAFSAAVIAGDAPWLIRISTSVGEKKCLYFPPNFHGLSFGGHASQCIDTGVVSHNAVSHSEAKDVCL